MKPHYDNVLLQLTEEQQATVYDWLMTLGYTKTLQKLKQPPPDGLGLKTHRSCLHRFFKHYQQQVRPEDVAAAKENRSNPEDASVLVADARTILPARWLKRRALKLSRAIKRFSLASQWNFR